VARKYALQFKYTIEPDQDLFALGCGNLVSSMFSSYPTAGTSRGLCVGVCVSGFWWASCRSKAGRCGGEGIKG
jgi:hypothetical protein